MESNVWTSAHTNSGHIPFLFCYLFSFTGKPTRGRGWNRFQAPEWWRRKLAFHYFSTIHVYAKQLLPCYQNSYTTGCFIQSATYVPIRWNIGVAFSESERSFRSPTEQWNLRQSYCSIRERSRALALLNAGRISHFVNASFGGKCFHLLNTLMYIYWQEILIVCGFHPSL